MLQTGSSDHENTQFSVNRDIEWTREIGNALQVTAQWEGAACCDQLERKMGIHSATSCGPGVGSWSTEAW